MRIAAVNSVREYGGGEKWLVRQAGLWSERGHEVLLLGRPGARLLEAAAGSGLEAQAVPMAHDLSPLAVMRIAAALRRFAPDLVLCCTERAFRLAAPAARLAGRSPLVYRNGLTATFKDRRHNRLFGRWLAAMVVNTDPLREEMSAFGWIPEERLSVIRNGVDVDLYRNSPECRPAVRREVGTPGEAVVAAVIGRLTGEKGQVEAIRAMESLAREFPAAELWIAGDGPHRERLESLAHGKPVRFLGFRSDVPALLQAVDVVLQPSHREGMANTVLEAMAAARPVVGSAVGGLIEAVVPGETGALVPPGDAEALARALRPLLADEDLRLRWGAAGRDRVAKLYPLQGETDAWCALFRKVTGAG